MDFMNELEKNIEETNNISITENGMVGYKSAGTALVDMNFKIPSYRAEPISIDFDFDKAFDEDPKNTIKWLFYLRDIREGVGERESFRFALQHLAYKNADLAKQLIPYVAEYGRFDDLFCLFDTPVEEDMLIYITEVFIDDMRKVEKNQPITLLAKWMPSINTSSKATRALARKFVAQLSMSEKTYRQTLSRMRAAIDVVEKKMSANNWENIDYEKVPSKANLNYTEAFRRHDGERYDQYIKDVAEGKKKINSKALFPYEVFHKMSEFGISTEKIDTLNALWNALPEIETDNTLVICDGSYSMTCPVPGTSARAIDVSRSMAMYCAERAVGEFKNKFITFSSRPQLVKLTGKTPYENYSIIADYDDCSNTDIEKVFQLILDTAIKSNMAQEDLPKNLLIISDMEFDRGVHISSEYLGEIENFLEDGWSEAHALGKDRLFDHIREEYAKAGYELPRLIFWNVASRTNTIPEIKNDNGILLISGFSCNLLKTVFTSEPDPYKCLLEVLNVQRYSFVDNLDF